MSQMRPCIATRHNLPDCFILKSSDMCENCRTELEEINSSARLDLVLVHYLDQAEDKKKVKS
jgi:hypothetical protein